MRGRRASACALSAGVSMVPASRRESAVIAPPPDACEAYCIRVDELRLLIDEERVRSSEFGRVGLGSVDGGICG